MRFSACMLLVLLAGVCVAQTHANLLDKIKDKVDDVKDKVTGQEDQPKGDGGDGGEEKKKEDKDSYEGGIMKQVAHSMADAAVDRLAVEAKDQYGNPLLKPVISIAAKKVKGKIHDKINDYGEEEPKPEEEKKDEAPAEGEKKEEEKSGLSGLIDKVMKRRKRGVVTSLKNLIKGGKKADGKDADKTGSETETATKETAATEKTAEPEGTTPRYGSV